MAQSDRAMASGAVGWKFESSRAHQECAFSFQIIYSEDKALLLVEKLGVELLFTVRVYPFSFFLFQGVVKGIFPYSSPKGGKRWISPWNYKNSC